MKLGYDLFRKLEDGASLWLDTAATMKEALARIEKLQREAPGEYFVRNAETGQIIRPQSADPSPISGSPSSSRLN